MIETKYFLVAGQGQIRGSSTSLWEYW